MDPWLHLLTAGLGALSCLAIVSLLRRQSSRHTSQLDKDPAVVPGRTSATERAVQIIREIHSFSENVLERIEKHSNQLEKVRQLVDSNGTCQCSNELRMTAEDLAGTIAEQRDLFDYLQTACRTIQRNSQCIESYVTDALIDPLTKIANRRAFDYELARRFSEWNRQRTPLSMIMVDIDHFKQVNDLHGHQAGDELLQAFARLLRKSLRETDQVARYGGEEFGIILPNSNLESAEQVSRSLCECIEKEAFEIVERKISLTASAGLATAVVGDDERSLIRRADLALYAAKRAGRNCAFAHTGLDCECIARGEDAHNVAVVQQLKGPRDAVTELHDAAMFREYLEYRIAEHFRYGTNFSIMSVRIDGFMHLQETSVRRAEVALRSVARFLTAALRAADFVSRLEQDRFAAVLPATALEEVLYPAERLRRAVSACDRLSVEGVQMRLTVSIGAAEVGDNDTADSIITRVCQASDAAQAAGGNCIYGQDQGMCLELDALSLLPELVDV